MGAGGAGASRAASPCPAAGGLPAGSTQEFCGGLPAPLAREVLALPGDLTLVHVKAPLWHEPHPSLRLLAAEGVEVVNVGGLVRDLEVANAAVTLQDTNKDPSGGCGDTAPRGPTHPFPPGLGRYRSHPIPSPSRGATTEQHSLYTAFLFPKLQLLLLSRLRSHLRLLAARCCLLKYPDTFSLVKKLNLLPRFPQSKEKIPAFQQSH